MSDYKPSWIVIVVDVSDLSLIDAEKLQAGIRMHGPPEYGQRDCNVQLFYDEVV